MMNVLPSDYLLWECAGSKAEVDKVLEEVDVKVNDMVDEIKNVVDVDVQVLLTILHRNNQQHHVPYILFHHPLHVFPVD